MLIWYSISEMDAALQGKIKNELIEALTEEKVLWEKTDLLPYTKDTYNIRFDDEFKYFPDFVVFPQTTSEMQEIVKIAAKYKIPLIPKGGGSNRTGMLVPIHGGIILDTIKMNAIVEINKTNLLVTVQPGITLKELEEHLAKFGLALNQEQGSFKMATVGGSISTSGYSRKHQKYGTIADRIMSLEVVLADGSVLRTGQKVLYTSTGYRLHQLFVGAEGTLGIITEATLRLEPLPEAKDAILAFYDDFWAAVEVAKKIMASCVTFVAAEAYETPSTNIWGAPPDKKGIFYVNFEGTKGEVKAEVAFVKKIIKETGGLFASKEKSMKFIEDYTLKWCGARAVTGVEDALTPYIPLERMREFYDRLYKDIMPKYGLKPLDTDMYGMDVGRYLTVYGRFFIPKSNEGWESYQRALREIAQLVVELGGSISGCHGVGIEHRDNLELEFSTVALETMKKIKKTFDPENIMNPGKKLKI